MGRNGKIPASKFRVKDRTGQRLGRLTVLDFIEIGKDNMANWLCRCDCGTELAVRSSSLATGNTKSCGCLWRDGIRHFSRKHGRTGTAEYRAWNHMIDRCTNPKHPEFKNYGGRGIRICPAWRESFDAFIESMGEKPYPSASLERINNNGDYEPSNCCWASKAAQSRNTRRTKLITFRGETQCATEWARRIGINLMTLKRRLQRGWPIERALTETAHEPSRMRGPTAAAEVA